MKCNLAPKLLAAGLMLAQFSSYNGGIPITPGTSVPESNPATAIAPPQPAPPASSPAAAPAISTAPPTAPPSGPAYSFGAAPPPVVAPAR